MKVLFGLDGSEYGKAAVQLGGRLLSGGRDSVVFYFSPPQLTLPEGQQADPLTLEHMRNVLADSVFEEAKAQLPGPLADTVETIVGVQTPARGLLLAADQERADLFVLGARGSGAGDHAPGIGSVVRKVVNRATIPVLVVRPPAEPARPLRVLWATDGSDPSHFAGQFLHRLTWPQGSTGRVLSVVESPASGQLPEWMEEQLCQQEADALGLGEMLRSEEQQQRLCESLQRGCGELPAIFAAGDCEVAVGSPSREILRVIREEAIDLVVVGGRGAAAVERLFLGSTSEYVLSHAACSVLIVRRRPRP